MFSVYYRGQVAVKIQGNTEMKKKMLLWRIYVASNNKTYLGLHVKFHTFLSDSNQISDSPQY